MNKDQTLGQIRAALTAAGTVLATWGINDGNAWAPIVGVVVAAISLTWGLLHHKDPATQGSLKWSLVRKFANVAGSAAITYGLLNPEKVQGIEMMVATLGPLLASWFSWIDNSETDDSGDESGGNTGLWLLMLFVVLLLPGCANMPIHASLETPYGDITTDSKGTIVIAPRANVIRIPLNEK